MVYNVQTPPEDNAGKKVFIDPGRRVEADFSGAEVQIAAMVNADAARSYRMSCSEPNLANLPQKGADRHGRSGDVVNAIYALQTAVIQLESGETDAGIDYVKSVMQNLATAFHLEDELEAADPYASWTTTCPKCHVKGKLEVAEVTLSATGERHRPCTPLKADGFDVNCDDDIKDQSTEDEEIVCRACGSVFDLGDLDLHKEKPVAES